MERAAFEHVIAAAANVTGEDEFVVIGSQAILGAVAEPPPEMLASMEADLYPRARPDLADQVDGALGDGSAFHQQFGYFARGVGPETVKAPAGWTGRLARVDIPPRVGSRRRPIAWCLEPHDLVLSKLARGAPRDHEYARAALDAGIVGLDVLSGRARKMPSAYPASGRRRTREPRLERSIAGSRAGPHPGRSARSPVGARSGPAAAATQAHRPKDSIARAGDQRWSSPHAG